MPPLIKKPPKPVDEKQALILTCRRGKRIDRNGMPMLVENDSYNRDRFMSQMQSIRFDVSKESLNNTAPGQSQAALQPSAVSAKKKSISASQAPAPRKPLEFKGSKWMKKVDELIEQFDAREKESQA